MKGNGSLSNLLLLLAFIFLVVSLSNLFIALQVSTSPQITGRPVGSAQFCLKHTPTFSMNLSFTLREGDNLAFQPNYTNPDARSISFEDDDPFFTIDPATGFVNFTPDVHAVGSRTVAAILRESDGFCYNSILVVLPTVTVIGNSTLQIWDETDTKGGNHTRHAIDRTLFFANYTASNGTLITQGNAQCYFRINLSGINYSDTVNMTYNGTYGLFVGNYTTNANGNFTWEANCNGSTSYFDIKNATDNVTIFNNAPVLISAYPNQTWNANTVLFGPALSDYFIDTDGDTLAYTSQSISNINITIDNLTSVVKFTPQANFFGNRTVIFSASDGYGGVASTDPVYLHVVYTQTVSTSSSGGGSSGSSGGGGGAVPAIVCEEAWECTQYGPCLSSSLRMRSCVDNAACDTMYRKPNESQPCSYHPTCNDSIRNQGEAGVDCGGPCQACPTCSDQKQNQGETGIDCGGPCPACASCYDNIQNQGEIGIDCGGSCAACASCSDNIQNQGEAGVDCGGPCTKTCPSRELPKAIAGLNIRLMGVLIFLAIIILILSAVTYKYVWPHMAPLMRRKKFEERVSISEVISQTLHELSLLKKRSSQIEPKEIVDEVSSLMKTFLYHFFDIEASFSYGMMKALLEKKKLPAKLQRQMLEYARVMPELQYSSELKKEQAFATIATSEALVRDCAKAIQDVIIKENAEIIGHLTLSMKNALKSGNLASAKKLYARISNLFDTLPEQDKKARYAELAAYHKQIVDMSAKSKPS